MAIRTKNIKGGNGINYTKELDGPSDWAGIAYNTYFKDLSDGLIYWKNQSGVVIHIYEISGGDGDYGSVIFVSEVGPTGGTRSDVIGKITNPVELNWATRIAQSGDTIHVKAGVYNYDTSIATGGTLSVTGVNHYFEEGAKVYNNTINTIFVKAPGIAFGAATEGNVYGGGSFYATNSANTCNILYDASFDTDFSTMTVFEFNECTSVSTGDMIIVGLGGSTKGIIIKGKNRIVSYSGTCMNLITTSATKITVDCPQIVSEAPGKNTITNGSGGGSGGDLIIKSHIINSFSTCNTNACISLEGSAGRVICTASYIKNIYGYVTPCRLLDITAGRIDSVAVYGDAINLNAHVGDLTITNYSTANVALCDRFNIVGITKEDSVANICMSNALYDTTGSTSNNGSYGTLNLTTVKIVGYGTEIPDNYVIYTLGSKEYSITSLRGKTNLIGNWNNGDTITNVLNGHTLNIDSNAHIKNTTINAHSGTLEILGRTDDSQINYTGGTIIMNGATMIVSDQNKQIITTPSSSGNVKVYSGGLNTNKMNPFTAEKEKLKVNVLTTSPNITINGETFTVTTGTISSAAAGIVSAINASGTLAVTATQDTPGADSYFYIEANAVGVSMTVVYNSNVSLNEKVRYANNGVTDIVGGTVIEDSDIT
tara:strand:- start:37740 stop:39701 length:1962 start_codon:yes stop_codon:yes gene_type:complete